MKISVMERLKLIQTLNGIMPELLDTIILALEPPSGVIPPLSAAQGQRVSALLRWAESPGGCGLSQLQQVLTQVNPL